jgi:hypothetical protein
MDFATRRVPLGNTGVGLTHTNLEDVTEIAGHTARIGARAGLVSFPPASQILLGCF